MDRSLCEYFYKPDGVKGHRCGYCKSKDTSISQGMWAHKLTCTDYQDLIYRGWRRSGKYCYKPVMNKTCCPQYCIQCDVKNFQLSHSQKTVLKKMNSFLVHGKSDKTNPSQQPEGLVASKIEEVKEKEGVGVRQGIKPGVGADPTKAPCRKAKVVRLERKREKVAAKMAESESVAEGASNEQPVSSKTTSDMFTVGPDGKKPLEMFLDPPAVSLTSPPISASLPSHTLEIRLIQSSPPSPEFKATFETSFRLFKKYQTTVHKEKEDEVTETSFRRFLCDSPLVHETGPAGWPCGYGSYHQHYLIDGNLIAVGVLDFLPNCLSSVYVYYDVDYSFLSLGVYTALREIALTRSLIVHDPERFKYYCMGYYIHSCPKMRYKVQYTQSYLLCPESYRFVPIELCHPKLDSNKFSRLYDGKWTKEEYEKGIASLTVLYQHALLPYKFVSSFAGAEFEDEVREFVRLVGPEIAERMILALV